MESAIRNSLLQSLDEVELAVERTKKGQGDLSSRLADIQTTIATLPSRDTSKFDPKRIQEAQRKLKAIEDTLAAVQKRVDRLHEISRPMWFLLLLAILLFCFYDK